MGLTESNQSRSSFWGPSKSKSTHFADGVYEGKPRQAVTLPSRPLTKHLTNNAISTDDCALAVVNSRPPDGCKPKELYACTQSVQNSKSEKLINYASSPLKFSVHYKSKELLPAERISLFTPPRGRPRNILHLRQTSLSAASLIDDASDNCVYAAKKIRSRSHNYRKRDSSSSSRKDYNNEITVEEKETQTFPEAHNFAVDYNYTKRHAVHSPRRSVSYKDNKNGAAVRRSRKNEGKSVEKFSCSVPTTPSDIVSDPYICLHYGDNLPQRTNKEYEESNSIPDRHPGSSEACLYIPKQHKNQTTVKSTSPKRKKSQILIQLDNRNASYVDKPDKRPYEVSSNVWYKSCVNVEEKNYLNGSTVVGINDVFLNNSSTYDEDVPELKLEEKSVSDLQLDYAQTGAQINTNQSFSLSDYVVRSVGKHDLASDNHINNNVNQIDYKSALVLETSEVNKDNCKHTSEKCIKSYSLSSEEEKSSVLPFGVNDEYKDISVDGTISVTNPLINSKMEYDKKQEQNFCFPSVNKSNENCQIKDAIMSTTLSSLPFSTYSSMVVSEDHCNFGSRDSNFWYYGSQASTLCSKKARSSPSSLASGTFPVLRLPKLPSQPKLADILRRRNENFTRRINSSETDEKDSFNDAQSKSCEVFKNIVNVEESALSNYSYDSNTENFLEVSDLLYSKTKDKIERTKISQYDLCKKDDKGVACSGRLFDYENKTIPSKKEFTYREKLKRFFSLRVKRVEKMDTRRNCNLMCHEQCQGVVSLDCKMDSPDGDLQFHDANSQVEDISNSDFFPLEDNENQGLIKETSEHRESFDSEENLGGEENVSEGEEEKHEEEMLEKEIKSDSDMSSLKKQEVSTLRRTVRRIQSRTVDSAKIEEWVQKCPANNVGLQITKEDDGGYRGCLRIHLNLSRPINIVTGTRPPSIYDILQEERTLEKTLTSFYMPRDIVKAIHITSKTTTNEVIVALLRKFKVVDNPQKFALYERTYDTGQSMKAILRRLADNECPLVLAIAWNAQDITNKRLVLQENDTADIQWEAFSLPELDNFLRILDREEKEYKNQIRDKYSLLRQRIQFQLFRLTPNNV